VVALDRFFTLKFTNWLIQTLEVEVPIANRAKETFFKSFVTFTCTIFKCLIRLCVNLFRYLSDNSFRNRGRDFTCSKWWIL